MRQMIAKIRASPAADTAFLKRFDIAQRAWQRFAKAEMDAIYPEAPNRYGSVQPMCECYAREELIRQRIGQLKDWIGPVTEGDVCAGSRTSSSCVHAPGRLAMPATGRRTGSHQFEHEPQPGIDRTHRSTT
jgi:Lysozyme inhibitor LprI